jgi:outer membrane protein OmpA-like peptidoglycan-associated protein
MRKGAKVTLKKVLFERSLYALKDSSKRELDQLVDFMKKNTSVEIRLIGHTDNTGDDKENMKLSENRVKEVKKYLVSQGISGKRIQCLGMGETKPIADNSDPLKKPLNRRVEVEILKM